MTPEDRAQILKQMISEEESLVLVSGEDARALHEQRVVVLRDTLAVFNPTPEQRERMRIANEA